MAEKRSSKSKSAAKPYPETAKQPAGKVAEGVATYVVRSTPKPSAAVRMIAGLSADDEVWAFVKTNNLRSHLETAIRLAQKTFIDIRKIWLSYEPDPELPKFNSIVIWVKAHGKVEDLFEQEKKYIRAFNESIPPDFRHQIGLLLGIV